MFTLDVEKFEKLERQLDKFSKGAVPYATRNTLNTLAARTRRDYLQEAKDKMTLRNTWTQKSIRFDKTNSLVVSRMESRAGSVQDYMQKQEEGHTEVSDGKQGVAIPTNVAATGSRGNNRTKAVRRAMMTRNIQLRRTGSSQWRPKQKIAVRLATAVKTGRRFVYMDLGRRKGIFRVYGGSKARKLGKGTLRGARLEMIHDLTRKSVKIPKNPMLRDAVRRVTRKAPEIHAKSLQFQVRRLGLFK